MSNEAVIIELYRGENAKRRTVANASTIGKGDLLTLADPNTVTAHAAGDGRKPFGGIAAEEKVANDGSVNIGAYTRGVFDLRVSGGTCAIGDTLVLDDLHQNIVKASTTATISGGIIVGVAEEAGSDPETIRVRLGGV